MARRKVYHTSSAVPKLEASKDSLPSRSASVLTTVAPVALAILLQHASRCETFKLGETEI